MRAFAALLAAVLAVLFFSHSAAASVPEVRQDGAAAVSEAWLCDDSSRPEEAAGHWARIREEGPSAGLPVPGGPRALCAAAVPCDCGPCRRVPYAPRTEPPSSAVLQVFRC
ncbi:hypothetical protein AS200_44860 (plasmid) [Streptomyces sp. CdTB01]|nr:hypothetical protein AS200_44860 [Streptomyces sp. CdTB01]